MSLVCMTKLVPEASLFATALICESQIQLRFQDPFHLGHLKSLKVLGSYHLVPFHLDYAHLIPALTTLGMSYRCTVP